MRLALLAIVSLVVVACEPGPVAPLEQHADATTQGPAPTASIGVANAAPSARADVPAVVATAPGILGPKGDGTCIRKQGGAAQAAPCPNRSNLEKLSDDALSPIACDWAASCDRMGIEGCCVGCSDPFAVKFTRTCALQILRSDSCDAVRKGVDRPGCTK